MPVSAQMYASARQFDFIRELFEQFNRPNSADLTRLERSVRVGFMQNFVRQSVGGGAPWAPLAPRTIRERVFQGYPGTNPILRRSGAYAMSWTRVGGWRMFSPQTNGFILHVASSHPWAFEHELGDRARRLPARAVRYLDGGQERVVASAIVSWADSVVRRVMT